MSNGLLIALFSSYCTGLVLTPLFSFVFEEDMKYCGYKECWDIRDYFVASALWPLFIACIIYVIYTDKKDNN